MSNSSFCLKKDTLSYFLLDVFVNRFAMFHEMMLVLKFSAAEAAGETWFDAALHSFMQVQ
jgi:hypothetical protein